MPKWLILAALFLGIGTQQVHATSPIPPTLPITPPKPPSPPPSDERVVCVFPDFSEDRSGCDFDTDVNNGNNLVINGGFESPELATGWARFRSLPGGWKLSEKGTQVIEIQNNVAGRPCEGQQFVELDSDGSSAIYQDIPTEPGQTYEISFVFTARGGTPLEDNRMEVTWGDNVIANITAEGYRWKNYSYTAKAVRKTTRLMFTDKGIKSDSLGSYLDAVLVRLATDKSNQYPPYNKK